MSCLSLVLATFDTFIDNPFLLALFVGHDLDGDLLEGRTALAVPGSATPAGSGRVGTCGRSKVKHLQLRTTKPLSKLETSREKEYPQK